VLVACTYPLILESCIGIFSGFSIFKIKTCACASDSFEDVQRMENKILYQAVVFSDLTPAASQKKY